MSSAESSNLVFSAKKCKAMPEGKRPLSHRALRRMLKRPVTAQRHAKTEKLKHMVRSKLGNATVLYQLGSAISRKPSDQYFKPIFHPHSHAFLCERVNKFHQSFPGLRRQGLRPTQCCSISCLQLMLSRVRGFWSSAA